MDSAPPAPGFFRQFLAAPRAIGAIAPSSPALARAMLAPVRFAPGQVIVEFGPGTGAFTTQIAPRLVPLCRYVGIELNPLFCTHLAAQFPTLDFAQGSVADLRQIMAARGITHIDAIVCGLPWASLPAALQATVFGAIAELLAPDGLFVTFAYVQGLALPGAWALRRSLRARFREVRQSGVVWRNLPPAFAYICAGNGAK